MQKLLGSTRKGLSPHRKLGKKDPKEKLLSDYKVEIVTDKKLKTYSNYTGGFGMVGSLRRSSSVNSSQTEENSVSRRRTVTGDGDADPKPKHEALPDILHDWEIIVKSLREKQSETDSNGNVGYDANVAKPQRNFGVNSKAKSVLKTQPTDSDKENLRLRKQAVLVEDKSSKVSSTFFPSVKSECTDSFPHDSKSNWKRPTRSTYREFENIFESSELGLPLSETDKKEILAIKKVLSPSRRRQPTKRESLKLKRLTSARISRRVPQRRTLLFKRSSTINKRKPSKQILKKKIQFLKTRQGLRANKYTVEIERTINEKLDLEKSTCRKLFIKVENLKLPTDPEMDFIGFGTPFATSKQIKLTSPLTSPLTFECSLRKEKDEEEDDISEISFGDDEMLKDKSHEHLNDGGAAQASFIPRKKILLQDEFDTLFDAEDATIFDFEGFPALITNEKTCLKCHLVLENSEVLKRHIKIAHKRIYACPFNVGNCPMLKGSSDLHHHLITHHISLISVLELHLNSDLQSGKIATLSDMDSGCAVCMMPLHRSMLGIHEMLVHGIWPPSVLNLSSVSIDQHVSLWWTGRTQAFACHLCHNPQSKNYTIPIVRSAPHSFPTLLSNHLRNVHLLNLPLFQGWYLLYKLLLSLPVVSRRTLATTILLGVDSKASYSVCRLCNSNVGFYSSMNLNMSQGLCSRCLTLCQEEYKCWFGCDVSYTSKEELLCHFMMDHESQLPGAWCIDCSKWCPNIVLHYSNYECKAEHSNGCTFCSFKCHYASVAMKVCHTLSSHLFCCPIPDCMSPQYAKGSLDYQNSFSSPGALYSHLLIQHLPEWGGFSLEQVSSLILNSKKTHGVVLTTFSAQHLNGVWVGLSGHRYSLVGDVLRPIETAQVSMSCILCSNKWEESVEFSANDKSAVCPECILLFLLYENGAFLSRCPVYRCNEAVYSRPVSNLRHHLERQHKLSAVDSKCIYCREICSKSPLSPVIHNLVKHKIACLLCPFYAPTAGTMSNHWETVHGLPSWNAVFQHLKILEFSRQKNKEKAKALHGVVRVWSADQVTKSQWDPSIELSELISDLDDNIGVINQSHQEDLFFQSSVQMQSNEIEPWCTSLCSVSMSSPNKSTFEKDIKPDVSEMPLMSPDLLIPSVSVGEHGSDISDESFVNGIGQNSNGVRNDEVAGSSDEDESTNDRPLEIDSSAQSPESQGPNSQVVTIPLNIASFNTGLKKAKKTKTATFDALNSVMEETLHSMSKTLSDSLRPGDNDILKLSSTPVSGKNVKKCDTMKDLSENAFIDEKLMAENILKDLEDKYSGTCVNCGNTIQLSHLKFHIKSIHPGKMVHCSCGFQGELYNALVHMFHMCHIPNEARPIVLGLENGEDKILIVLEARLDMKTITYPCYKCSKRFKQEKSRQLHYNLCKLEKKFNCDVCGEKFALENHLRKHKEWKHNPQICKYCGKTFNSSSSLAQHVLHVHKKPSTPHCKQCGDVFNTSKQLKVHWRIHTGEQPHSCKHCTNNFISRNLLTKHVAKTHKSKVLEEKKSKYPKLNGVSVSSSDSSDSDSSGSSPLKKPHQNHGEVKVMALTESDLDTSSSEMVPSAPLPQRRLIKRTKAGISPRAGRKDSKGIDLRSNKAGIYQDKEVISLPEVKKHSIKAKVESIVGRVCAPCGQEFDSAAAKLLHMYLIHPGLVLSLGFSDCSFCNYKFSSADDVTNHHLEKHQRTFLFNGNFRCLCGLVFREDGAYYFHLYYAHKAQRALNIGGEIVCRLCPGHPSFNEIVDLVVHLSDRHTMFDHVRFNDSYMCNFCYKAFESWTVLSLHFVMVHNATKSQTLSYDCPYCEGASPWHSLEALQYHLDNVHRGRHTQSRPVPERSRSIYTPAPAPCSPAKRKELSPTKMQVVKKLRIKSAPPPIKSQTGAKRVMTVASDHAKLKFKKVGSSQVLYCICQSHYDETSDMIGCDNSNCKFQWFHFKCVGITSAPEGNWYCQDCTNKSDHYGYYSNASQGEGADKRVRHPSTSSNSSNSSNSSSSSTSNSSSSSSSSSGESSTASGDEN